MNDVETLFVAQIGLENIFDSIQQLYIDEALFWSPKNRLIHASKKLSWIFEHDKIWNSGRADIQIFLSA